MLFCSVEKTPASTFDRIPQQGEFSGGGDGGKTGYDAHPTGFIASSRALLERRSSSV